MIVESPNKIRSISKYLGSDYIVRASIGHFRDLPKKELGVDVENQFKPKYVITNKAVLKQLKEYAERAYEIYLATDPDREGEAIAWHLQQVLKSFKKPFYRVYFYEITEKGIKEGISNPTVIDTNLVEAQQARRVLDRLVGYNISPAVQKSFSSRSETKISAGRVQSAALRLICERQEEIDAHQAKEYWRILGEFQKDNITFSAELQEVEISSEKEVKLLIENLQGKNYHAASFEIEEKVQKPQPPFTTSTLQQEAAEKLGLAAEDTMKIAQKLFEGGYITYHRTDSTRINETFQQETLQYIYSRFGKEFVPINPQNYTTKETVQEAHEAIRPTELHQDSINLPNQEKALYRLIAYRYIASQMANAVYDAYQLLLQEENEEYTFKHSHRVLKFPGFLTLYGSSTEEDNGDTVFPEFQEGDRVELLQLEPLQCFTKPPSAYTEKSLIQMLEKKGIGRPSTYAGILSGIKKRGYVVVEGRSYSPTELGKDLNHELVKHFPDILEISFTSRMEQQLDDIAKGKLNYLQVINDFYHPFSKALAKAKINISTPGVKGKDIKVATCCKCKTGAVVLKEIKKSRFYGCTNYPECDFTLPEKYRNRVLTPQMIKQLLQDRKTSVLTFKKKDLSGEYKGIIYLTSEHKLDFEFAEAGMLKRIITAILS